MIFDIISQILALIMTRFITKAVNYEHRVLTNDSSDVAQQSIQDRMALAWFALECHRLNTVLDIGQTGRSLCLSSPI